MNTIRLVNGRWFTFQRLPIFGRVDFTYHLGEAYKALGDGVILDTYLNNDQFKYHCDECLKLHHIPPDQLSDTQFVSLLFGNKDYPYGYLNEFNFNLSECAQNAKPREAETKGSLLGKLWKSLGDLNLALHVAQNLPADVLEDALYELKPQEDKYKDKAKDAIQRLTSVRTDIPR